MSKGSVRWLVVAIPLLVFISGCATPFAMRGEHRVVEILDAYRVQNERLEASRSVGVRKIAITVGQTPLDSFVTVDLDNAPLAVVVRRILEESKVEHSINPTLLSGRVSASFQELKLIPALNILLRQQGLHAAVRGAMVTIDRGSGIADQNVAASGSQTMVEVPIYHGNPEAIVGMFTKLEQSGGIQYALHPDRRSILLKGDPAKVSQAVELVSRGDREPAHVIIEALVVEFDVSAYERLGMDIVEGQKGRFSAITTNTGISEFDAVKFTWAAAAANPGKFMAVIDALVAEDSARIVARPYVSTASGKQAIVNIAIERYVFVQAYAGAGANIQSTVASTQAVSSGVKLAITPTVLDGDRIQAEVDLEASHFLPPPGNVAIELRKNAVKSSFEVKSGQTTLVAGLSRDSETLGDSGLPGLRRIPILNFWLGYKTRENQRTNVVVFLTPSIWVPGMNPPMVAPNALSAPAVNRSTPGLSEGDGSHKTNSKARY